MVSRDSKRGSAKKDTCQLANTILESSRTYRMVKHCGAPLKQAVHTFISRDRSSFIKFMATVKFIRMPNAPPQKWPIIVLPGIEANKMSARIWFDYRRTEPLFQPS